MMPHRHAAAPMPVTRAFSHSTAGITALVASVVICLGAPTRGSAQVANGTFELNPVSPFALKTAPAFIDSPNWWHVMTGAVKVGDKPGGTPCHAGHCVALNASGPSKLAQVLPVSLLGQRCTVGFWMSRDVSLAAATVQTLVNNAVTGTFTHNAAGVSATNGRWEQHAFTFTAAAATTIAFSSSMPGTAGPQVDDVFASCSLGPNSSTSTGTMTNDSSHVVSVNNWVKLRSMTIGDGLVYHAQSAGNTGSYAMGFEPSAALTADLNAFLATARSRDKGVTTLSLEFKLWDASSSGDVPGPAGALLATSIPMAWNGASASSSPRLFSTAVMQPNHWYRITTRATLNNGTLVFPGTPADAPEGELAVRVSVPRATAAKGATRSMLQVRSASGQVSEREVR